MNKSTSAFVAPLGRIVAQLPLIDKTDLSSLMVIAGELETIAASNGTPKAFVTQAGRALSLVNHIIMTEIGFDEGCKKLSECVGKMRKSIGIGTSTTTESTPTPPVTFITETPAAPAQYIKAADTASGTVDDDIRELIIKFASSQQSVLEDFEAYILEFDKGDPLAKAAIQRVLHTWKGEFGVLDMSDFSKFIHDIEDRIEQNSFSIDHLFRLKDLLAGKFVLLSAGNHPALTEAEKNSVCQTVVDTVFPEQSSSAFSNNGEELKHPTPPRNDDAPEATKVVPQTTTADILSCDASLLNDFINESRDHLHTAETLLLELETDPNNKENLNSIFRAWHTIKGIAGFLGLKEVSSLAHKMESQMDLARKDELVLGPGPIDVFLEANDCLKNLVSTIESAMRGDAYNLPEHYGSILNRLIAGLSNEIVAPTTTTVSSDKKIGELLIESGKASPAEIDHALEKQAAGDTRKIGEILLEETSVPARDVGNALATQTNARQLKSVEETIRVPVNRIDQLVDSIGEAVIAQSMVNASSILTAAADQALMTKMAHANTILRQIQELAMSLRMVSIKATFQKMARLARDLSKKCGRDIEFITDGEDTELDKSVVENIGDPLIHMIRNSIDHGIEAPEDRAKTGKPLKAIVKLRAFHRAGSIFIEVIDDGKGLNRDAIFEKAVSRGLCKAEANLSDQEIFQFIFLPGFSTAKVVTDVSGRGVGMDVVRRNIEALRGSVEISSTQGKGTTFSIRLPLTLAIVDGMVVRSGSDRFIIPTLAILESIKASAELITTVLEVNKMIRVREELIPLVHLGSVLHRSDETWDITNGIVMIVEDMLGKKIGLFLDEILGQQQVVIKSLGDGMGDIPGVTGGAIMSDGAVSLILDVGGIVKLSGENYREKDAEAVMESAVA